MSLQKFKSCNDKFFAISEFKIEQIFQASYFLLLSIIAVLSEQKVTSGSYGK